MNSRAMSSQPENDLYWYFILSVDYPDSESCP